jgi:hypothetical protein
VLVISYGDELLSLCTIGNWLLQLPHEDPTAPIRRISYGAVLSPLLL